MTEPGRLPSTEGLVAVPTYRDRPATTPADLSGVDLAGCRTEVPVCSTGASSLLLFLSSGCEGCLDLFQALGAPDRGGMVTDDVVVVVAKGSQDRGEFSSLVPDGATVVLSDDAWSAYQVQGPPFFVLVDGVNDRVVTEGVAWSPGQVGRHVAAARRGQASPEVPRLVPPGA